MPEPPQVFASANTPIEQLVSHASSALTLASRAFFNPGMLALLYFPPEHTYAVYTPMFLPMAVPLIASLAKEFRRWRQTR
jgi:phosphatidylinositol glycan class S